MWGSSRSPPPPGLIGATNRPECPLLFSLLRDIVRPIATLLVVRGHGGSEALEPVDRPLWALDLVVGANFVASFAPRHQRLQEGGSPQALAASHQP